MKIQVIDKKKDWVWQKNDDNFRRISLAETRETLDSGLYTFFNPNGNITLVQQPAPKQQILEMPDNKSMAVFREIERFWRSSEDYKSLKKPFRRSFILYGDPGSGKSYTINMISQSIIKNGGLVVQMGSNNSAHELSVVLQDIRHIEPDRKLLVLLEDIDAILEQSHNVNLLLNILDGIISIENVVYIATTNYIERLEPRVSNRPNRFDKVMKIPNPSKKSREMYLEFLLKDFPESKKVSIDLAKWCADTTDLSFAHLTELVTSTMIYEESYEKTLKTLKGMKKPEKSGSSEGLGFATEPI